MSVAEDVAQEAFIEFWKRSDHFGEIKAAKGFIYTVTRNRCLNHIKSDSLHKEVLKGQIPSGQHFCELVQEEETYRVLYRAITDLADQSRKIISLSMKGFKNSDIAAELDISVNTVKTLKKGAYRELRSKLKGYVFLFLLTYHQIM